MSNNNLLDSLGEPELSNRTVALQDTTEEDALVQLGASNDQIQALAKQDLDFLAALIMPLVFKYCFPDVFKSVWTWLLSYVHTKRTFPQLALGLPRGFGKSTLMKIFLCYCILFTDRKFLVIVGSTAKKAESILADVMKMLEEPNIVAVFGDWKLGVTKDTQAMKKFGFRGRDLTVIAAGAETDVRGLNINNERPDVILMDDIQSKECAKSAVQSETLEDWLYSTLMKCKSPSGCMFLFVANMYPTKLSILRKLKANHKWLKFIAGGISAKGESLWEELQPIKQLMEEFENDLAAGHPEIFYSEVLNDENASVNNRIDLSKLPPVPYADGDIPAGSFIIIDPASDKVDSDAITIGYFEVHSCMPILMEMEEGRFSPGDTIRIAYKFALRHNCRLIVCEANAYQYSLLYWFTFIAEQLGIQGIEIAPIYSGMAAKSTRILNMFKSYAAGEIFVHDQCKLEVHLQISQYNPLRRDNTDGLLDLLTYAPRVIAEFEEYIVYTGILESQTYDALDVPEHNSCF